jgi:phage tail-like protein
MSRDLPQLLGTSHFRVLVGRREVGVAEVSRLSTATDEERVHRYETVVLRRALTQATDLYDWRRRIVGGRKDRRAVTIQQLDSAGGAVVNAWRLDGAWPCRWSGPSFDASTTAVAMEELELAYDELVWLQPEEAPRSRTKTQGA